MTSPPEQLVKEWNRRLREAERQEHEEAEEKARANRELWETATGRAAFFDQTIAEDDVPLEILVHERDLEEWEAFGRARPRSRVGADVRFVAPPCTWAPGCTRPAQLG